MKIRRGGSRKKKIVSLFPSEDRCWIFCVSKHGLYSHGYVQMEKEEGSFVRVEVSFLSEPSLLCLKL